MSARSVASLNLQVSPIIGIPLKVYVAYDDPSDGTSFRLIHNTCGTGINRPSVCRQCNREIGAHEIVKAYQLTPTQSVRVTDEELKALKPAKSDTMVVETYLNPEDLDPSYFSGGMYRLMPSTKDTVAFCTFRDALAGRYALAKVVMTRSSKEQVVAIRADGRALAMHFLRTKAEMRDATDIPGYDKLSLFTRPEYVDMMSQLIASHEQVAFESVTITKDRYVTALQQLLAQKIAGIAPTGAVPDEPEPPQTTTSELMQRLQQSLAARGAA